jgi:hypothetical protein
MTVALTTRGIVCPRSSRAESLISWGFLCSSRLGFNIEPSPFEKTCVFNKDSPILFDPDDAGLFSIPRIQLTGRKSPLLGSKRPSLSNPNAPSLFNPKAMQLTGSKVITIIGKKSLLLSEPQEPTLTSSGTKAPDIFNKDCCDDDC